ncbi:PIR Superfamily Protein, partial [Plasmodium malariae]
LYEKKKEKCCKSGILACPHYFFNCGDEFNPEKILSLLISQNGHSCNGLELFTETKIVDKKLDTDDFGKGFLDSILLTDCSIKDNSPRLRCGFIRVSSLRSRNENAVEHNGQQTNSWSSYSGTRMRKANADLSEVLGEKTSKEFAPKSEEKNKMLLDGNIDNGFRWNYKKGGLRCLPNISEDDKYGLCEYMDELVKNGIFIKTKDSDGHIFKKTNPWTSEELRKLTEIKQKWKSKIVMRLALEQLRNIHVLKTKQTQDSDMKGSLVKKLSGAYSGSNILRNTFFTPFGSCLGKIKKRKKKYRTNFTVLNTERLQKRFIKRTYRNSNRRRFSVVNVER